MIQKYFTNATTHDFKYKFNDRPAVYDLTTPRFINNRRFFSKIQSNTEQKQAVVFNTHKIQDDN